MITNCVRNCLRFIGRIDSFPMKRRKRLVWKITSLLQLEDMAFELDFYGLKYQGHTINHIDKYVYYFGAYEKGILKFIKESLLASQEKIFLDIGANIGHHSLFASQFSSKVFSFEPYPKVREQLEKKLRLNNISNVHVLPFALGENDESLPYFEPSDHNTGTGSFIKDFLPSNKETGLTLTVKNGASTIKELGIDGISLIKIDTEGFEPLVLAGLLPKLKSSKPVIIMEFSKGSQDFFQKRPEVTEFLISQYEMRKFIDPNELNYEFTPWNFDSFGNIALTPKS